MGRPRAWAAAATGRPALLSPAARRQRGASIGNASGRRSLAGFPARTPGWWPVCRQQWERGGSVRVAACVSQSRALIGALLVVRGAGRIAILCAQGCGVREVARRIGRAPSTISRELHRSAATRAPRHWNCPGTHPGFDERCQRRQQAARPRSCPDTTPPADASTTFASPANDDPTRSYRPGTGRCRLGCAEQSRFIWRPSSRTGLRQWHIHWPRAPHAVTVPMENDASTAASPRPLPVGPNQKRGL